MPPLRQHFLNLREEKYMIHQYKMFDQNIVLDICSGSIHVVDEIAYDMIAEFLDKDKNTLVLEMKEKYPSVDTS